MDEGPIACSSCGNPILGGAIALGLHQDDAWSALSEDSDWVLYEATGRKFALLNPKCLYDLIDEVLRQENAAALIVHVGQMEDLRVALEI